MPSIYSLSALFFIIGKADIFLLPCPFKYLTHFDCPGCGFQRSALALIQGDLAKSFDFYPPTIPFLMAILLGLFSAILKWNKNSKYLKAVYLVTGFVIALNYLYKIATHQLQ